MEYDFKDPENTVCLSCKHVLEDKRTVLYVSHDDDDSSWQFLCGDENHQDDDARMVAMSQVVVLDESLNDLSEMPEGYCAEREAKGSDWTPYKL